jgi:NtrC-family two-component system sensor histidine kinase KinB
MSYRLQNRFLLCGCLLVAAAVGSSVWSAWTFMRLNRAVNEPLRVSQEAIDLSAELHSSLEREDDALLLYLSGKFEQARSDLEAERRRGGRGFERLTQLVVEADEQALVVQLRQHIDRYRAAGDALLNRNGKPGGLEEYHLRVNPFLRQAVAACDQLREANFRSMQQAGVRARDEAARGTQLVLVISLVTMLVGIMVAVWLARSILGPIRELMQSVESIRQGVFDRRVQFTSDDELGQLGAEFNRMAETLAEYRRSSLGELITIKMTLEATLKALPEALLVFDPDGNLVEANPLAQRILAAKQTRIGARLAELPLSETHQRIITAALAGQPSDAPRLDLDQTFNIVLEGQARRFLLKAEPVPEFAPQRCGAVVVLDDITALALLEELRSELIGTASHELKSPLTAMQMNLMLLREAAVDWPERLRQSLDTATASCEELRQTIDELLDLTLIEAGQLRLNASLLDLRTLFASVGKMLLARFEDATVRLELQMPSTPVVIKGDAKRLQSVFANVLTNALKYSPPGGVVSVAVSSGQNAQALDVQAVQITVTDQGPGVPVEFRERIFEKFFRVEHHLSTPGNTVRGTGIGLYLCRQIIQSHGGTIGCEAAAGHSGTRFVIRLPSKC